MLNVYNVYDLHILILYNFNAIAKEHSGKKFPLI